MSDLNTKIVSFQTHNWTSNVTFCSFCAELICEKKSGMTDITANELVNGMQNMSTSILFRNFKKKTVSPY